MSKYLAFHLHPDVWLVVVGLGVAYWFATTKGPVSRRQKVWFFTGLFLMWGAAEWPVHDLAEHFSYGIHMAEHLVFTLACAPMMLLGIPGWLMRWLVVDRPWYQVVRFVCRPVPALAFNAAVLLLSHWPAVVDETTHNEWFHFGVHCVIFGSALALFMPVINRLPELPRLERPAQILYLFAQSMAPIPPTLWLIFSTSEIYKAYLPGLHYLGWSPTGDLSVAGSLMGAVTPVVMWSIMAYIFFAWYGEEEREERHSHLNRRDAATGPITAHASNTIHARPGTAAPSPRRA